MARAVFVTFFTFLILMSPTMVQAAMKDMNVVVLRSLDKVSARTSTFEIPVGKTVKFGRALFIKVQACRKASPIEKPESASFLQIWEKSPEQEKGTWVFSGWMFASSPALSAMDHPVYDVWVLDCKNATTDASSKESFTEEDAPEDNAETSSDTEN